MLGFYFLTTPDLRAITLVITNLLGCCQRQQTTQNEQHHSVPIRILRCFCKSNITSPDKLSRLAQTWGQTIFSRLKISPASRKLLASVFCYLVRTTWRLYSPLYMLKSSLLPSRCTERVKQKRWKKPIVRPFYCNNFKFKVDFRYRKLLFKGVTKWLQFWWLWVRKMNRQRLVCAEKLIRVSTFFCMSTGGGLCYLRP